MDKEGNILYDIKINDEWTSSSDNQHNERRIWADLWQAAYDKIGYGASVQRLFEPLEDLLQLFNAAKLVASNRFEKLAIVTPRDVEIRSHEDGFESVRTRVVFSETMQPSKRCVAFSDDDALLVFVDRHNSSDDTNQQEKVTKVVLFDTDSSSVVCAVSLADEGEQDWSSAASICGFRDSNEHVVLVACRNPTGAEAEESDDYELHVLLASGDLRLFRCSLTGATRRRAITSFPVNSPVVVAHFTDSTLFIGTACNLPPNIQSVPQLCPDAASLSESFGISVWSVLDHGSRVEPIFAATQRVERTSLISRLLLARSRGRNSCRDAVRSIALSPNRKRMLVLYEPDSNLALFDLIHDEDLNKLRAELRRMIPLASLPDRDCELDDSTLRVLRRARRTSLRACGSGAGARNVRTRASDLAHLSAASWWDDESIVVARLNGRLRVYRLTSSSHAENAGELRNRLGTRAECFALAPCITSTHQNGFYIVDVSVRRRVSDGDASDADAEVDGEPDADADDDCEDDDVAQYATGWMQRAFGAALRARLSAKRAYRYCAQFAVRAKQARHGQPSDQAQASEPTIEYGYRLMQLKSSTCEELFERKIALEEYGDALQLAAVYSLDVDRVYEARWERARPVTCAAIQDFLAKISMRRMDYVLRQCADSRRAPDLIDAQEALLRYALRITDIDCLQRVESEMTGNGNGIADDESEDQFELADDADANSDDAEVALERSRRALRKLGLNGDSNDRKLSPVGVKLVRARRVFLEALDRLHTFEEVLGGRAIAQRNYKACSFRRFVAQPLVTTAIELARAADVNAVRCCLQRHAECATARLSILSELPETLAPRNFSHLLPSFDSQRRLAKDLEFTPWRVAPDWCELIHLERESVGDSDKLDLETEVEVSFNVSAARLSPSRLQAQEQATSIDEATLANWIAKRARQIEALSGLVDHAVSLVRIGLQDKRLSEQSAGLGALAHDLGLLETMVYTFRDDSLSLAALGSMSELDRFRRFLAKCLDSAFSSPPASVSVHVPGATQSSTPSAVSDVDVCRVALVRHILPYLVRIERLKEKEKTQSEVSVELLRASLIEAAGEELSHSQSQSRLGFSLVVALFAVLRDYYAAQSASAASPSTPTNEQSRTRVDGSKRGLLSTLTGGTLSLLKSTTSSSSAGQLQSSPSAASASPRPTTLPVSVAADKAPAAFSKIAELLLIGIDCAYAFQLAGCSDEFRKQRSFVSLLSETWSLAQAQAVSRDSTRRELEMRFRVLNYDLEVSELLTKRGASKPLSKIRSVIRAYRAPSSSVQKKAGELENTVQEVRLFLTDFVRHTLIRLAETRRSRPGLAGTSVSGATPSDTLPSDLSALLRDVLALADRIEHDAESPDAEADADRHRKSLTPLSVVQLFAGAMLSSANLDYIEAARAYLTLQPSKSRGSPTQLVLDFDASCELIARACADYSTAAASVDDDLLDCARACLSLVPKAVSSNAASSLERERRVLRAAELLNDAFGLVMLPVRVRIAEAGSEEDKLGLVRSAITSSDGAYALAEPLAQLGTTLGVPSFSVHRLVVQHAVAVARDYTYAYTMCERLVTSRHSPAWKECAELAISGTGLPPAAKLQLLGFAFTHCDESRRLPSLLRYIREAEGALLSDCFSLSSTDLTSNGEVSSSASDPQLSSARALSQLTKLVPVRDIVDRLRNPLDVVSKMTSSLIPLARTGTAAPANLARELCSTRFPELGLVRPLLAGVGSSAQLRASASDSGFYSSLGKLEDSGCWTCLAFANCDLHAAASFTDEFETKGAQLQSTSAGSLYRVAVALVLVRAKTLNALVKKHDASTTVNDASQSHLVEPASEDELAELDYHQCFSTLLTSNAFALRDLFCVIGALAARRSAAYEEVSSAFDDWLARVSTGVDRLVALIGVTYFYALSYVRESGLHALKASEVSLFGACQLIDTARLHFLAKSDADAACLRRIGDELCKRYDALLDLLYARRLDASNTGVDIDRFLSDAAYRQDTVLGLAMTLDQSMLTLAIELAARHQIETIDVLIAFVENLFDESLDADQLNQMIAAHAVPGLLASPEQAVMKVAKAVYPRLDGTRYDHLLVFFDLIAQLSASRQDHLSADGKDEEERHLISVIQDVERHAVQLRKLKSAFSAKDTKLDFKKLLRFGEKFDQHVDLRRVLTPQNVHAVASCVSRTTRCQPLYSRVLRVFLESLLASDFSASGSDSEPDRFAQRFEVHLQQYAGQLPPAELAEAVENIVFEKAIVRDVPRSLRVRALDQTVTYLKRQAAAPDDLSIGKLKRLSAHLTAVNQHTDISADLLMQFDATRSEQTRLDGFFSSIIELAGASDDADAMLRNLGQFVELANTGRSNDDRFDVSSLVTTAVKRVLDAVEASSQQVGLPDQLRFADWRRGVMEQNRAVESCLSRLRQLEAISSSDSVLEAALGRALDRPSSQITQTVACLPFTLDLTLGKRRSSIEAIRHRLSQLPKSAEDVAVAVAKVEVLLRAASQPASSQTAAEDLKSELLAWLDQSIDSGRVVAIQQLFPLCCVPFSNLLPAAVVEAIVATLYTFDTRLGCVAALSTEIEPLHVQVIEYLWNNDDFETVSDDQLYEIDDGDICEAFSHRAELCVELRKMCSAEVSDDANQRRRAARWFRAIVRHLLGRRVALEQVVAAASVRDRESAMERVEEHKQCLRDLAELLEADDFRAEAQMLNKSLRMPPDSRTVDLLLASLKV